MRTTSALLIGFTFLGLSALARGDDWPQFRGQNGSGLSAETKLPATWAADKNVAWKVKLPGYGWSSPIVAGDKVFLTTAVSDKQTKPRAFFGDFKKGGFRKGGFGKGGFGKGGQPPDAVYQWEVYCLDRATGKVLWHKTARKAKPTIPAQMGNTYASETPVTDGERVYAYFGTAGVYCYDLKGKLVWSKDLGTYKMMMGWGTGSSPALDGDRLFIQCDNEEKSFIVALDKKTGKQLWRVPRPERSSWSSPFVWRNKKRTEVVACGSKKVRSYDPATGKVLWECGGMGGGGGGGRFGGGGANSNATPVADAERIYFGTGGPFGGSPLFAVKAGASGDITLGEEETSNAGVAWSRTRSGPYLASPLLYEGRLYVIETFGGLSCYDAKTGKPAYQRARLQGARSFTSSPWAYGGKVFCLAEDGTAFVVKAGPKFQLLGKNTISEMFWASPAASGGALFLRGVDHLYCIKE
jgi:outer membrane protein assembly factor BamB